MSNVLCDSMTSTRERHDLNRLAESEEEEASYEVIDGIPIHSTIASGRSTPSAHEKDQHVGLRLAVWWRGDGVWRHGKVINKRRLGSPLLHLIRYDHGGIEWINLAKETIAFESSADSAASQPKHLEKLLTAPPRSAAMPSEDLGARCFELLAACRQGDALLVEELLARDDCPKPVEALLEAVAWSHVEVVRLLLDVGCSTDGRGTVLCAAGVGIPYAETRDVTVFELSQRLQGTGARRAFQIAAMLFRRQSTDQEGDNTGNRRASVRQHRAANRFVATPAPSPRALKAAAASRLCNDLPSDLLSDSSDSTDEVRHGLKRRLTELSSRPKLAKPQRASARSNISSSASDSDGPAELPLMVDAQDSPHRSTVAAAYEAVAVAQELVRSGVSPTTLTRPEAADQNEYRLQAKPVPLVVASLAPALVQVATSELRTDGLADAGQQVGEEQASTIMKMLATLEEKEMERRQHHDALTTHLRDALARLAP